MCAIVFLYSCVKKFHYGLLTRSAYSFSNSFRYLRSTGFAIMSGRPEGIMKSISMQIIHNFRITA